MSDEINLRIFVPTQRWITPDGEYVDLPLGETAPEGYELFVYSGYVAILDVGNLDDAF